MTSTPPNTPRSPTAQLLQPEVQELIQQARYAELREVLHDLPRPDVAEILIELEPAEAAVAFRILPRDDAGEVFSYVPADDQERLIQELGTEGALRIVEGMDPDDRARLIDELPPEVAQRLIASLSPENRRHVQAILGYPEESVGRLMTPEYIAVRPEWTVAQAMEHIRRNGRDAETIDVIYVVDSQGVLLDDLRLRQIFLSDPQATIESLMDRSLVALSADQDQEEAVRTMSKYDRSSLPVVDRRGVLVGIVTADDVADVAEEEVTEDIQKLGGMEALDEPYMRTGIREMYKKRGFWLSALFIGQTITVIVLGSFEETFERAAILVVFLPLVISCGGNSGSQAAMLVTRALALQELAPADWIRIVRREVVTGMMLGSTLALLGVAVVAFAELTGIAASGAPVLVAATVGTAVLGVILWGTIVGSLLPLVLRRLGFDPAVASTPLVATLMDATGMLIYLAAAIALLTGVLL
jgi:magnesium transporter